MAGTLFEYALVSLLFFVVTLFYTDFVLLHGTHQLFIEGPGDGTAGFLWFNFADTDWNPLFGHTDLVNYPTGENLASPTFVTYSALLGPLWLLTKFFGAIMALNIVTFFGFFGCAMTMYWLTKRLTGNIAVSVFAGFAAAFVPYHVMKSSSHLAYIFSMVFILIIAAFIGLWRKPGLKRAILLAATIALAFYTDGYYLLIASVLTITLVIGGIVYEFIRRSTWALLLTRIKYLTVTLLALVVFLLPIGYIQVSQGGQIKEGLSKSRDDIAFDLQNYSAKAMDLIVPSVHNPFLMESSDFQQLQQYKNSRSNASENTLYIGFILIGLCALGLSLVVSFIYKREYSTVSRLPDSERTMFMLIAAIFIISIPILLFWMLPPQFSVFGHEYTSPSGVLLHNQVALWRVMARFFLPLHIVVVIFASLSLAVVLKTSLFVNNKSRYLSIGIVAFLALVLSVEYASMTSRPAYDFNHTPAAYSWLRDQKDIQVIAELPLLDRPFEVGYDFVTAQIIHGKKLINSHLSGNPVGGRTALGDEDEGEAIDYAIARGAQAVITHNSPCHDVAWGRLVYKDLNQSNTKEAKYYGSPICIYRVASNQNPDRFFVNLEPGTFADAPLRPAGANHEYSLIYGSQGKLTLRSELGDTVEGIANLKARIQTTPGAPSFTGVWRISQRDIVLATGAVGGDIDALIDAALPVTLTITDMQGQDPRLYQVALSDVRVTGQ